MSIKAKWKRLLVLSLPALLLACSLAYPMTAFAQQSGPTQKLFQAVLVNDMNAVKSAIMAGADLGAKNADGKTAADVAVDKGHFIIAHHLLSERSAKNTAKRLSKSAISAPEERLRKPAERVLSEKSRRQAVQSPVNQPKPAERASASPDTATHVTKALVPSTRKPRQKQPVQLTKQSKYGKPPIKPAFPSQMPVSIAEEVVVAPPPDPAGVLSEAPAPEVPKAGVPQNLESVAPEVAVARPEKLSRADEEKSSSLDPVGAVSHFFQSLVDLVSPSEETGPDQQAPSQMNRTKQTTKDQIDKLKLKNLANGDQLAAGRPVDDDLMAEPMFESVDPTRAQDAKIDDNGALTKDLLELSDAEERLPGLEELEKEIQGDILPTPAQSASARTLDRIKNLLGDTPEEDEFGLPTVEISSREKPNGNDAADSVLEQLADGGGKTNGFLDDRAGPETGPGRQPINDTDRDISPVSDALRARLLRLGDALSRDVKIDTEEILRSGRSQQNDAQVQVRAKRPIQRRRADQFVDELLNSDNQIEPRTTTTDRFAQRLEDADQLDQQRENAYGIPIGEQRVPLRERKRGDGADRWAPVTADPPVAAAGVGDPKDAPSVLDRMVGFFGGAQTEPSAPKTEKPDPQAPDYRGAPSTRQLDEELPVPEIENLQAFDQVDETKPVQQPGTLEPVFLNRLAGLFSEEEKKQNSGWKAEIVNERPFPNQGKAAQGGVETPWTTKVEVNVGEGKEPVVIEVAQAPLPQQNNAASGLENTEIPPAFVAKPYAADGKPTAMAKEAYGDPLRAPDATETETRQKTFFGRLTKLFQPKDPVELQRESLMLEQDERLSTAHDASGGGVEVASRTEEDPKTYWPIVKLTKTDPLPAAARSPRALTRTSLDDVTLTLGESVNLVNIFPPGKGGSDPNNQCVKKNRGTTLFCIEPVDWSNDIRSSFMIATILYTGPMAVVRYDQTAATRLHTLFNSEDFDAVTAYYQKRYGEPTEILKRSIAPLAKPRQDNPTVSWRSRDQLTNAITVLEIRKFDDTRGGFPDTSRGAVMLYYSTSPSIFPQVSAHELMRLKRIVDITQSEQDKVASEAAAPALAPASANAGVSADELFGSEPLKTDEVLPIVTNSALDSLMDDQSLEKPEDILNEPDLMAPDINANDNFLPSDLTGDLPGVLPSGLPGELRDEPITDEAPDQLFEIPPIRPANPS